MPLLDATSESLIDFTVTFILDSNGSICQLRIGAIVGANVQLHFVAAYVDSRIVIGLINAPGPLKQAMNLISVSVNRKRGHAYLNNTAIVSKIPKEKMTHLKEVRTVLQDAVVTIDVKTVFFFNYHWLT